MEDGMICVDSSGYLNSFNKTAEMMLGMNLDTPLGKPVSDFADSLGLMDVLKSKVKKADEIINFKDNDIVVNSLPIMINDRVRGAVSLLKEGSVIHGIDRKLRARIYKKGFIAKHQMKHIVAVDSNMRKLTVSLFPFKLIRATMKAKFVR